MPLKVKLHSNAPTAADATEKTIQSLPTCADAYFVRGADGQVIYDGNGFATLAMVINPGFLRFALTNQGYVADVI